MLPEAQHLQDVIAAGDRTIALAGISGTKFLLQKQHGYGGVPRRPLQPLPKDKADALWSHPNVQALVELERALERAELVNIVDSPPHTPTKVATDAAIDADDSSAPTRVAFVSS